MARYIVLCNYTDQGIRNVKGGPSRVRDSVSAAEATGVKIEAWYLTMGAYDIVAIADVPDDEAMASFLLSLGAQGNVRSQTLRAFPLEEFEQIVAKLP